LLSVAERTIMLPPHNASRNRQRTHTWQVAQRQRRAKNGTIPDNTPDVRG
jgi:hypothetical protein